MWSTSGKKCVSFAVYQMRIQLLPQILVEPMPRMVLGAGDTKMNKRPLCSRVAHSLVRELAFRQLTKDGMGLGWWPCDLVQWQGQPFSSNDHIWEKVKEEADLRTKVHFQIKSTYCLQWSPTFRTSGTTGGPWTTGWRLLLQSFP